MSPTTFPMFLRSANHAAANVVECLAPRLRKGTRASALPISAQSSTSTLVDDSEPTKAEASTSADSAHQLKRTDSNSSTSSLLNAPDAGKKRKRAESPVRSQTDNTSRKKGRVSRDMADDTLREPEKTGWAPWVLPLSSENVRHQTVAAPSGRKHDEPSRGRNISPIPAPPMSLEPKPRPSIRNAVLSAITRATRSRSTKAPVPPQKLPSSTKAEESNPPSSRVSHLKNPTAHTIKAPISLSSSLLAEGEMSSRATHPSIIPSIPDSHSPICDQAPNCQPLISPASPSSPTNAPPQVDPTNTSPIDNPPPVSNGKATRVEIDFDTFSREVFLSHGQQALVDKAASAVMDLAQWSVALENYAQAARSSPLRRKSGQRKNRIVDLLNLILEEAPRCEADLRYKHEIRYSRHDFEGGNENTFVCSPPSSMSSSDCNETPDNEPWEDDSKAPCIGAISQAGDNLPVRSAWARAALIVDVYAPFTEDSPPESPIGPLKRKAESEISGSSPPKRRRTSLSPASCGSVEAGLIQQHVRLSPVELEHDWYLVRKLDTDLEDLASRAFRETGNRRHVLGALVKGMKVRFYLYDHAGVIFTPPLDLRTDTKRIIATILSVSLLDALHLGLEPVLAAKSILPPSELFQRKAQSYVCVSGVSFYLESLIHAGALYERGCVVYHATPALPDEHGLPKHTPRPDVPEEVVLKMSWQLPSSNSEDKLLLLAASRGVKGIARLYRSDVMGRLSEGLRGRLTPASMYADRELRVQVTGPRAIPLAEVNDLDTFKVAFRSLVVAHRNLYEKASILHRDISVGNLMVNADNHEEGVLIDLDIAAQVDTHGDPLRGPLPPAGTLPFRAYELVCLEKPTKAYYRHDLESFFYVLLWLQTRTRGIVIAPDDVATFGFKSTWKRTQNSKRGFLLCYNDTSSGIPDVPLRDEWLTPLRSLFGAALFARVDASVKAQEGEGEALDDETLGGRITFCTFYSILEK